MSKTSASPIADLGDVAVISNWGRRIFAWLLDVVLVGMILGFSGIWELEGRFLPVLTFGPVPLFSPTTTLSLFAYWTVLEWLFGRSVGKLIMRIMVLREDGGLIGLRQSAIQAFGKSFLIFIDFPAALILKPLKERRMRSFNRLSHTVVVRVPVPQAEIGSFRFAKEP